MLCLRVRSSSTYMHLRRHKGFCLCQTGSRALLQQFAFKLLEKVALQLSSGIYLGPGAVHFLYSVFYLGIFVLASGALFYSTSSVAYHDV